jgi:uncharacterized protein (TIGR02246 family)
MSRYRALSVSLVLSATVAGWAVLPRPAQGRSSVANDEAAVRAVVQQYVAAREARDPKLIQPLFTGDADQLVSDGVWRHGREELVQGMLQSSQRTGGRRTIEVESVRFVAPTVALADGRYRQTGLVGGANRDMWTTLVLTREGKVWRITAIRNMLPAPPAAPVSREETPK